MHLFSSKLSVSSNKLCVFLQKHLSGFLHHPLNQRPSNLTTAFEKMAGISCIHASRSFQSLQALQTDTLVRISASSFNEFAHTQSELHQSMKIQLNLTICNDKKSFSALERSAYSPTTTSKIKFACNKQVMASSTSYLFRASF